ncbi:MAG: DUF4286 family protein [Lewinellaceae bacterium]|nr:DUF4286 family protein [Saprospiraceae bacterium]MCB9344773.1 DUF4286 family protein [Lewinellaceae bacterium]
MFLYNVTITIDLDVHEDWVKWMKEVHIPEVMITGMFISYRMSRLIGHEHTESEIYTVQYLVKDMAMLTHYQNEFAPELQKQHHDRYNGKFAAFRTVMELIDHNDKV